MFALLRFVVPSLPLNNDDDSARNGMVEHVDCEIFVEHEVSPGVWHSG